jgi:hypothetical protein
MSLKTPSGLGGEGLPVSPGGGTMIDCLSFLIFLLEQSRSRFAFALLSMILFLPEARAAAAVFVTLLRA